ncbi:Txe/YoeB family addiction module toxin [Pantoea ananatis]|uniref:Txe/YoeB family addiction module toxin n=1 Tax=Pantoea ananas TaxID=553 RepID=UPI001B314D27|nr:Txe/YoeB family addiction module toxin [Pantoea ananatis]
MNLVWSENAWQDYLYWQQEDLATVLKINDLIKNIKRTPFQGLGKPEPLKNNLKGFWSRRITGEHRFVYRVSGAGNLQNLEVIQCRYHY